MDNVKPKFVVSGNTIEELAIGLAECVVKAGSLALKDTKGARNPGKYAIWQLNDGISKNPYSQGLHLTPETARRLATSAGAPMVLSVDVVLRQLTPLAAIPAKIAERQAAVATRKSNEIAQFSEAELEARLAELRAGK